MGAAAAANTDNLVSDAGDVHSNRPSLPLPTLHQELMNIRDLLEPSR
ncbi:MAG: hypothetical protein JWR74_1880, partial [Polaromonas sp.]|nr:hypothetical protein [Polaromonas sp.]